MFGVETTAGGLSLKLVRDIRLWSELPNEERVCRFLERKPGGRT